jgi:hypothetical protein
MMAKMGKYCKAYSVARYREFIGWSECVQNARKEQIVVEGKEEEAPRELSPTDYLYLQEDYTVTDGIYIDQNLIFSQITPEWVEFCRKSLLFEAPGSEPSSVN